MITSYGFGSVTIDGKTYTSDVIVFPEKTIDGWWRIKGHDLSLEDISVILDYGPDVIVVGTGKFGMMKVLDPVKRLISERGIGLVVERTPEAVRRYNRLREQKRAVAALHLTC